MVRCEFVFAFSGSIIACSLAGNWSFEYWILLLYHEGVGSKHSGYLARGYDCKYMTFLSPHFMFLEENRRTLHLKLPVCLAI